MLWLWCRLAAAAPIRPLAWEPLCAADVALKRQKDKKKKKPKTGKKTRVSPSSPPSFVLDGFHFLCMGVSRYETENLADVFIVW